MMMSQASAISNQSSTEGKPVHPRDDGLEEIEAAGQAAEATRRAWQNGAPVGRRRVVGGIELQVVACAECPLALARDHGHPEVIVSGEVIPDSAQFSIAVGMKSVEHFGASDGHVGDATALFVTTELHRSCSSSRPELRPGPRRVEES